MIPHLLKIDFKGEIKSPLPLCIPPDNVASGQVNSLKFGCLFYLIFFLTEGYTVLHEFQIYNDV